MAPGSTQPVDHVAVTVPLDPYLSVRALAGYSGLSIRKLRSCLKNPRNPLPHYRVDNKVLVRRSEFDAWMVAFRGRARQDRPQNRSRRTEAQRIADELLARVC